jgi:hypothetical protein
MNMHSGGNTYETDSVVPFAPRAAAPRMKLINWIKPDRSF